MKKKLHKPKDSHDDKIIVLYNAENAQDACCTGSNGQCLC